MYAEINELMSRELLDCGYAGVEIRSAPGKTEVIVRSSRPQDVLSYPMPKEEGSDKPSGPPPAGEAGRRIRELQSLIIKRFRFEEGKLELFAERVANKGLSAQAQADSLKYKLLGGLAIRRACYGIIRFVMENGAKGVEVVVAGKLRGQRAKAMKFRDGYMMKSGHSAATFNDYATRAVMMRQGMMGVRVKIMLPRDDTGVQGPKARLADVVEVLQPKEDGSPIPPKPTVLPEAHERRGPR